MDAETALALALHTVAAAWLSWVMGRAWWWAWRM